VKQDSEELQAQLEKLTRELSEIRRRLETLEGRSDSAAGALSAASPVEATQAVAPEVERLETIALANSATTVALVGRTLVVLGGAFLLRAISDAGLVPPLGGAAAALGYATWWLLQANRAADAGQRLSAAFHGVAAMMIAYPLIWETTARFELITAPVAAAALVAFLTMGLAIAWRREMWEIAWTITLFSLATTLVLLIGTQDFMPFTTVLLLTAVAVEVLAFRDRWLSLRWPVAFVLDIAVLMTVSAAMRPDTAPQGYPTLPLAGVISVAVALPTLYLGSIGARTLLRRRAVTSFEVLQGATGLLVGFSGAVRVMLFNGVDPTAFGVALVLLGAACYAAAFGVADRRSGRGRNFYYYTTIAGLLLLVGTYMILDGAALALTWSALAVAAVRLGGQFDRITLRFHGASYIAAAATVAGLLSCAFNGLFADPATTWLPPAPLSIGVALVAVASYGILLATSRRTVDRWSDRLPQAIVGAVVVWSVAGMAAGWLGRFLAATPGATTDAGFLPASRTGVIALVAVVLAWAGRRWSLQELTWLAYPVLVVGFLKLLFEDLRYGEPLTLFLGLAMYGSALIVTPRLLRKEP
jgi:hypothetical protein